MNTEMDLLIEHYLDGSISPEKLKRLEELLLADATTRRNFLGALEEILAIQDLMKERALQEPRGQALTGRSFRKRAIVIALALAACVTGLATVWHLLLPTPDLPSLAAIGNGVSVTRKGERIPVATEVPLKTGDIVQVDFAAKATLRYADSTKVELDSGTIVSVPATDSAGKGKLLQVERGSIDADVARQPTGQPFRMRSPRAALEVIGTRFQLHVTEAATRINVTEGAVRFQRLADDAVITVPAGQQAIASAESAHAMRADPVAFTESFDEDGLPSRGWYDAVNPLMSGQGRTSGSGRTAEFRFPAGKSAPSSGTTLRRRIAATEGVCISYWIKRNVEETAAVSEVRLMTNKEGEWAAPGRTHLTVTIGTGAGLPKIWIQDSLNIDGSLAGEDLVKLTEARSVAGGNGDSDGHGDGEYYRRNDQGTPLDFNQKTWTAQKSAISDSGGSGSDRWHHVIVYLQLNRIESGKGVADGRIKYWLDGKLVIDHDNIMFRTARHPDMKFNQFLIAPYLQNPAQVEQTLWLDDVSVTSGIQAPSWEPGTARQE